MACKHTYSAVDHPGSVTPPQFSTVLADGRTRLSAVLADGRTRPFLVLLLVAALAVSACSGLDVEVDHRTSSAPEPLTDDRRSLGTYEPAWTTQLAGAPTEFHLVGAHVVAVEDDGVAAYDARTGEPGWHYREPGRDIWRVVPVGETVILSTYLSEQDDESDSTLITEEHTLGIDAGTGEVLWETTDEWEIGIEASAGGASVGDPAAAEVFVVEPDGPFSRAGIDPRTGDEVWRVDDSDIAEACTELIADDAAEADGALVVTDITCDLPEKVVVALDAQTGQLRWRRPLPSMSGATVLMRAGATLIDIAQNPPLIVGPDGEDLFEGAPGTSCTCDLIAADAGGSEDLVLRFRDAESREIVVVIDPETGTATPVEDWPQNYGEALITGNGRIMTTDTASAAWLLPTTLASFDVASGEVSQVPWLRPQLAPLSSVAWNAVADGNLLTVRRSYEDDGTTPSGAELASYEPAETGEPLVLGGVAPEKWPDACALLTSVPIEADEDFPDEPIPELYTPGLPAPVGDLMIQNPNCSRWVAPGHDAYVEIKWVAATEEQAAALMQPTGPGGQADPRFAAPGVDEVRRWPNGQVLMRVGPVIVLASSDAPGAEAKAVLTAIGRQLRMIVEGG